MGDNNFCYEYKAISDQKRDLRVSLRNTTGIHNEQKYP
jgi:hypothetical protein